MGLPVGVATIHEYREITNGVHARVHFEMTPIRTAPVLTVWAFPLKIIGPFASVACETESASIRSDTANHHCRGQRLRGERRRAM